MTLLGLIVLGIGITAWLSAYSPNDRDVVFAQCETRRIAIYPAEDGNNFDPARPGDPFMLACMRAKNYEVGPYPPDCPIEMDDVRLVACYVPTGYFHRLMFDVQTGNTTRDPRWPFRAKEPTTPTPPPAPLNVAPVEHPVPQ